MKELKIEIPNGYEIDKEKSTFENIVFKEVKKGIEWKDFGELQGFYIDSYSKIESYNDCSDYESSKNIFPTKEEAEACLALSQLKKINYEQFKFTLHQKRNT